MLEREKLLRCSISGLELFKSNVLKSIEKQKVAIATLESKIETIELKSSMLGRKLDGHDKFIDDAKSVINKIKNNISELNSDLELVENVICELKSKMS